MIEQSDRGLGGWAAAGATLTAALSSACCWLPLLLLAVGVSTAGVSGFLEAYRIPSLTASAVLLGAGFYFSYFRRPRCAPDGSCSTPNRRMARFNKSVLWIATLFVAAFGLFPTYVRALVAPGTSVASDGRTVTLRIEGMTCEGCAGGIEMELGRVSGVLEARVLYDKARATVVVNPSAAPDEADLVAAVQRAGYKATLEPDSKETHRP